MRPVSRSGPSGGGRSNQREGRDGSLGLEGEIAVADPELLGMGLIRRVRRGQESPVIEETGGLRPEACSFEGTARDKSIAWRAAIGGRRHTRKPI